MSSSPKRIIKRPRRETPPISHHSTTRSSSHPTHPSISSNLNSGSTPLGTMASNPSALDAPDAGPSLAAYAIGRWREIGRPVPHDILLQIAHYLGDMTDGGDHAARLTLSSLMRVSNDAFDAAARTLYESVTVSRATFSQVFGGNDMAKSKLFSDSITFPTRASVVRKLGLFQYTKRLYIHDLPSEQAVADLVDAWRVSCSQPSTGVSCREALSGRLFPRLECVSFGPDVFLNHHSTPPLGPEYEGGLHRFLSFLRREGSPTQMCLAYPTPAHVSTYMNEHPSAQRPSSPSAVATAPDPAAAPAGPLVNEKALSRAEEAPWPEALARAWGGVKTITVHNVRFARAASRSLAKLPCECLRIFAIDSVCGLGVCEDDVCVHCDSRWSRAGATIQAMARASGEDKESAAFKTVEIANVGAGYELACSCSKEYANAIAYLKAHLSDRAEEAPWSLELPHASEAEACACCGAAARPTGDTEDGSPRDNFFPNPACEEGHRWEKGFRPSDPIAQAGGAGAAAAVGGQPPGLVFTLLQNQQLGAGPGPAGAAVIPMPVPHTWANLPPGQLTMAQAMHAQLQAQMAAHGQVQTAQMTAAQQAMIQAMQAQAATMFPNAGTVQDDTDDDNDDDSDGDDHMYTSVI